MIISNVTLDAKWVRDLPRHDIEVLARLAEEQHFEPGEVLFHHGELADRFYMIVSGTVALTLPWKANSFIVQTIIAREDIGWDALLDEGVRSFTAQALTAVQALVFNGPELCAECEHNPEFGFRVMKHLLHVVSERLDASRLQLLIRSESINPGA